MARYAVVKHTRDCEKEQRNGSVRVVSVTTWDVVDGAALVSEHRTKREAVAAVAQLAQVSAAASALGKLAKGKTSARKATSSAANGKLGGRPRRASRLLTADGEWTDAANREQWELERTLADRESSD